jgi:hypothetical protein
MAQPLTNSPVHSSLLVSYGHQAGLALDRACHAITTVRVVINHGTAVMTSIVGGNLVAHHRIHHTCGRTQVLFIFVFFLFAIANRLAHARQRGCQQQGTYKNMTQLHLGTYFNLFQDKVLKFDARQFIAACNV